MDWPGIELCNLVENPADNCLNSPLAGHYTSQHSTRVGDVADTPRRFVHRNIDPVRVSSKDMLGRKMENVEKRSDPYPMVSGREVGYSISVVYFELYLVGYHLCGPR